jgi:hypothetical protein
MMALFKAILILFFFSKIRTFFRFGMIAKDFAHLILIQKQIRFEISVYNFTNFS